MNNNRGIEKYFTTRDIVDIYPNNFGLQQVFKSFVNQRKIRAVKSTRMRIKTSAFALERTIPVNCYNPIKLYASVSEYLENPTYNLNSEKKQSLVTLLEIINDKIKNNEADNQSMIKAIEQES